MLKFAVQPGLQSPTNPNGSGHTHHIGNDNDADTAVDKKGEEHDCAICSARRLVINQEKSLVQRARSKSRDRLQNRRHRVTSADSQSQEMADESSKDIKETGTTENCERSGRNITDENDAGKEEKNTPSRGNTRSRGLLLKSKSIDCHSSSDERNRVETSVMSSSDVDSTEGSDEQKSRSSSRGRKRSTNDRADSGISNRRSRSHSRGRKRSTASIHDLKRKENSDDDRSSRPIRKSRSASRGRSTARQSSVVSDTELMNKNSSESESDIAGMPRSSGQLDLRVISAESKYRESCRTDIPRRGSIQNVVNIHRQKQQRVVKGGNPTISDDLRRFSDPAEMLRVKSKIGSDRRCSLPTTDTDGLMSAIYNMPRVSSIVRKATIRKCRSELDGFLSDSSKSSSSCSSDAESTSSGRHSTSSEMEDVTSTVIYECDEDTVSCLSVEGSCTSDKSSTSVSSNRSVTPHRICQLEHSGDKVSISPVSHDEDNTNSSINSVPPRSPSSEISSVNGSDSSVCCFEGINPMASRTKAVVVQTGEKTVARVRRLNTKVRRSSVGSTSRRRNGTRFLREDSSHLNGKELEMLIIGSCFGTDKCCESFDTSDYESEPGSESHTDSDCHSNTRTSFEDVTTECLQRVKKVPSTVVAGRLAGGGSYSPVKASQERYRSELDKMPKSDFSHKAVMLHAHKALSSVELSTKQGEAIYLHRKELEILKEQSPIWVMAYSKISQRIGFVPAVYVNIRLEDLL